MHPGLLMVSLPDKLPALEVISIVPLRDLHGKDAHSSILTTSALLVSMLMTVISQSRCCTLHLSNLLLKFLP